MTIVTISLAVFNFFNALLCAWYVWTLILRRKKNKQLDEEMLAAQRAYVNALQLHAEQILAEASRQREILDLKQQFNLN